MWLIRDAHLQLPHEDGKPVTPTDYLKKRVLRRSSNIQPTPEDYVVIAILRLFPDIISRILPRPSADPNIVKSLVENQHRLDEKFKAELQDLIDYIKQKLRVKSLCGRECKNGTMWGELVSKFVDLVNHDDQLALTSTYVTAAESALSKLSLQLVKEYKHEMELRLQGKYPLEENSTDGAKETLMSIHNSVLHLKQQKFESQVDYLLSVSGEDDHSVQHKKEVALLTFMNAICKLSNANEGDPVRIGDGALHQFAMENHKSSRRYCREVAQRAFRTAREAIQASRINEHTVGLEDVLIACDRDYFAQAIGPAKDEVYCEVRNDLDNSSLEVANTIPGKPLLLHETGQTKNKIKLQWEGTGCKDGTKYEIQFMYGHETWASLPDRFIKEYAVVENLKSNTDYLFQVRGVGRTGRNGEWSESCECSTTLGAMARGAATVGTFMGGLVGAPLGATIALPMFGPVSTLGGVVGAPIIAGIWAKKMHEKFGPKGELKQGNNQPVEDRDTVSTDSVSTVAEANNTEAHNTEADNTEAHNTEAHNTEAHNTKADNTIVQVDGMNVEVVNEAELH